MDQAILTEEEKLVVIRFGRENDTECMKMDEVLVKVAERVKQWVSIYVVRHAAWCGACLTGLWCR